MTWRSPALTFKCGVCGTTATGFLDSLDLEQFARDHADLCKGYPPPVQPPPEETH